MASAVGKYAAKKMLGGQMEKYKHKKVAGDDDPYFTTVMGKHGKPKKVKKQIPDFIPDHDANILASVKKRAYRLDVGLFSLFGIRFGWSSVIGLVPEIGDFIDGYLAYSVYRECCKVDAKLPSSKIAQMQFNIFIDIVIGLVPLVGDLADAAFRANTKNVQILEQHLINHYGKDINKRARHMSGLEAFDEDKAELAGMLDGQQTSPARQPAVHHEPVEPVEQPTNAKSGKGWFGFGGNRAKQHDEESGHGESSRQDTGVIGSSRT